MAGHPQEKVPVYTVPREQVFRRDAAGKRAFDTPPQVLAFVGDQAVIAKSDVAPGELKHLYVVVLPDGGPDCSAWGETLVRIDPYRVVMRVQPGKVTSLLTTLHSIKGARCGLLGALPRAPIVPAEPGPPTPWVPTTTKREDIKKAMEGMTASSIEQVICALSAMGTRVHDTPVGKVAATKVKALYPPTRGFAHGASFKLIDHKDTPQQSVVATIPGTEAPAETVILGCHIDTWNAASSHDNPAPGADDNASGVACLIAVFEALMNLGPPARTLELHGYAAEEVGRLGSVDIASRYLKKRRNVVAMLQLDMVLYPPKRGEENVLWLVQQNTTKALREHLSALGTTYLNTSSQEVEDTLGSSDHASWFANNYPTVWPFENPSNCHIHGVNDTLEILGNQKDKALERALLHARLALAFVAHFGGLSAPAATGHPPRKPMGKRGRAS